MPQTLPATADKTPDAAPAVQALAMVIQAVNAKRAQLARNT